jgi:hypothetical protein
MASSFTSNLALIDVGDVATSLLFMTLCTYLMVMLPTESVNPLRNAATSNFNKTFEYMNVEHGIATADIAVNSSVMHPSITFHVPSLGAYTIWPSTTNICKSMSDKMFATVAIVKGYLTVSVAFAALALLFLVAILKIMRSMQSMQNRIYQLELEGHENRQAIQKHRQSNDAINEKISSIIQEVNQQIATKIKNIFETAKMWNDSVESKMQGQAEQLSLRFKAEMENIRQLITTSHDLTGSLNSKVKLLDLDVESKLRDYMTSEATKKHLKLHANLLAKKMDNSEHRVATQAQQLEVQLQDVEATQSMFEAKLDDSVRNGLNILNQVLATITDEQNTLRLEADDMRREHSETKESSEFLQRILEIDQARKLEAIKALESFTSRNLYAATMYAEEINKIDRQDGNFFAFFTAWSKVVNYRIEALAENMNRGAVGGGRGVLPNAFGGSYI